MAIGRILVQVKDEDRGFKELMKSLRALANGETYVKAGVIGEKAQEKHVGSNLTVAELGEVHEYGAGHVPQRSFVRAPYDANKERYLSGLKVLVQAVYDGKARLESVLDLIGSNMGYDMRKAIRDGIAPPLAAATIARKVAKGRRDPETPLLDTRQLVNTVRHQVVVQGRTGEAEAGSEAA